MPKSSPEKVQRNIDPIWERLVSRVLLGEPLYTYSDLRCDRSAFRLQLMGTLSGGQKSRVAFAVLSLQKPHILLLDEVSASLAASVYALIGVLRALA